MNPHQPFQPPVTSQWPGAGPFPGPGAARPSGVTGVLGGVLSALAGLLLLVGMLWQMFAMDSFLGLAIEVWPFQLALILQSLTILLLLAGGLLLSLRVGLGRFMALAGAVLFLVHLVLNLVDYTGYIATVWFFVLAHMQDVVWFTLPLVLAGPLLGLLPSTGRWVSTLRT